MKLIHAADIHLGRRRLDGRLPDSDLADAFRHIAGVAIAEKADAFLLAGDLFDRPQVEPQHLRQAQEILAQLKAANVPVIAITGNHDKTFVNSDQLTWLDYLADDGLLILLETRFGAEGALLEPWDPVKRRGSCVDLGGVRFTGAGYLGASTPAKVRQVIERLEPGRPHVLLLHAGPDYFVGEGGGFSVEDLQFMRERVCYLALGHIHKPMVYEGWACNPGSPENCELNEARYDRDPSGNVRPRGYAWLEIDPAAAAPLRSVEIRSNPRRPVFQINLDCTPFGNKLKDGVAALQEAACKLIAGQLAPPQAAIDLRLVGKINLGRIALDLRVAGQQLERAAGVTAVALDASGINLGETAPGAAPQQPELSREEIERGAIRTLMQDEHLWGLDGEQETIARLFFELKEGIRANRPVEHFVELIQLSPLIDKIREAGLQKPAAPAAAAKDPLPETPPLPEPVGA